MDLKPILPFEKFRADSGELKRLKEEIGEDFPTPGHNHFYIHFDKKHEFSNDYRNRPYFKDFQAEQSYLEGRLTEQITRLSHLCAGDIELEREMHLAYVLMRLQGVSDEELFV